MSDKLYFRPVIPLLVSLITGIILGSHLPDHGIRAYIVVSISSAIILWAVKQKKTVRVSPVILFTAIGYLSIQLWVAPKFPSNHIIHYADTYSWEIVGVIDNFPREYSNRKRFLLRTETIKGGNSFYDVIGKIRVTVSGKKPNLFKGDKISFISKIRAIRNFNNPGGFDYERYMAFRNVRGTSYVSGEKVEVLERESKKGVGKIIDVARIKISDLIDNTGSGEQQGVLKALIIGDKNSIPRDLRESFNRAGVGHLLAISGLHIGVVATAAFIFFKWVFSHIKLFLWNAWTKKGSVVLSVIPVVIYGLLSGMSPSTQRAVIMVIVFLLAFLFEREPDTMNTLAVAAMVILVIHPPSLFSISFQLSFTAVFTIIYGLSKLQDLWTFNSSGIITRRSFQFIKKVFFFFLASLFAIIGTLPLLMYYFNQISLVGLLANFAVVPLIGFLVVPLGLISVFLYPLTNAGASLCIKVSIAILAKALSIVNFFANLPLAAIKTITPTFFEICCFYVLFWTIFNLKKSRSNTSTLHNQVNNTNCIESGIRSRVQRAVSRWKPARLIFFFVIFALCADIFYWLHNRFWHNDLRVTIIDVGDGNAALLELPYGFNILVDGGGFSDNNIFDVGARIIAPLLWRKKIKTIDTIILSHPNSDHLNGLIYIAENFNVKRVWSNNEASKTLGYKKFMDVVEKKKISLTGYKEIAGIHNIKGVLLEIFYPPVDFIYKKKREKWRSINNNSLVVGVRFGSISFIFPGDVKARSENELVLTSGDRLRSTVLIAPHHGSRTSSTETFLEKVNPQVVIISSRWKSRFGFPHPPTLKKYKERGYRIFGTAGHGAIIMSTDGKGLTIRPTIENAEEPPM